MGTASRVDQLLDMAGAIYESALDPSSTVRVLDRLSDVLGGCAAQLYTVDNATGKVIDSQVSDSMRSGINRAYVAYYGERNPRLPWIARMPVGSGFVCHELFDERFVSRNEFYQDFLIPSGMRWVVATKLAVTEGTTSVLGALRPVDAPAFDHDSLRDLRRLAPHFAHAARLRSKLEARLPALFDLEPLLGALRGAAALIDDRGCVVLLTAEAEQALQRMGARVRAGAVQWRSARNQASWDAGLGRCDGGAQPVAVAFGGEAAGWVSRLFAASLLMRTLGGARPGLRLAVFELEGGAAAAPAAVRARDRYELTPAETEIATLLLQGRSAKQIARVRGASVGTVRSQIASIYSKVGVHSQRELMATLKA